MSNGEIPSTDLLGVKSNNPLVEKTGKQLYAADIVEDGILDSPNQTFITYDKVRRMRRDPTIALVRQVFVAPALAAGWSYEMKEEAPEGAIELIKEEFEKIRFNLVKTGLLGCLDFGWQPYEKIFYLRRDGLFGIQKCKQLIQDITQIRVIDSTGAFNGLRQDYLDERPRVYLDTNQSLLLNFDVEGTNWYGSAPMRNVEEPYDNTTPVNEARNRYDKKIAGSHWVIYYPVGETRFRGSRVDNYEMAQYILNTLCSSGGVIVPQTVKEWVDDLNDTTEDAWKIEFLNPGAPGSVTFEDRLKYLNTLKVRGLGFTERSILEGQFGTKAEAAVHGGITSLVMEYRHQEIVNLLNWHYVNQLLRVNYGEEFENTVWIVPNPIIDSERQVLFDIYMKMLDTDAFKIRESEELDMSALRDRLELPIDEESDENEMLSEENLVSVNQLQRMVDERLASVAS